MKSYHSIESITWKPWFEWELLITFCIYKKTRSCIFALLISSTLLYVPFSFLDLPQSNEMFCGQNMLFILVIF